MRGVERTFNYNTRASSEWVRKWRILTTLFLNIAYQSTDKRFKWLTKFNDLKQTAYMCLSGHVS